MQSDLGDCFSEIKKHLMQETKGALLELRVRCMD